MSANNLPTTWDEARAAYETGALNRLRIAHAMGLPWQTVVSRSRREGWRLTTPQEGPKRAERRRKARVWRRRLRRAPKETVLLALENRLADLLQRHEALDAGAAEGAIEGLLRQVSLLLKALREARQWAESQPATKAKSQEDPSHDTDHDLFREQLAQRLAARLGLERPPAPAEQPLNP